jgi:hypothetical protein
VKKFNIAIEQVENGLLVYEAPHPGCRADRTWVAKDITKLQLLVGDLYEKHQEENLKREQTK